jgi:hypothetical protein
MLKASHGDHTRAIEYDDVNIVLRTEEKRRKREREREISIYLLHGGLSQCGMSPDSSSGWKPWVMGTLALLLGMLVFEVPTTLSKLFLAQSRTSKWGMLRLGRTVTMIYLLQLSDKLIQIELFIILITRSVHLFLVNHKLHSLGRMLIAPRMSHGSEDWCAYHRLRRVNIR